MRELYEPCPCCGGFKRSQFKAESDDDGFDDLIRELADAVYNSKQGGTYSPELVQKTADKLTEALTNGYSEISVDWDTPDKVMIDKLVEDVFTFSAAKNYQQLRDMTLLMVDDEGEVRSFSDFESEVEKLGLKYNRQWLQTEYDTAIGSATMAARWVEYENEAEIFPLLKYKTVGDNRVRADHRILNGIIRNIIDKFWETYWPPNGFGCRCDVEQVPESDASETALPSSLPHIPDMFKTNLAKTGLIFPKGHPYYDGVPKDHLRRAMQYIPQKNAYRNKGRFEEHAMLQYEPEAEENREIALLLARKGEKDIQLLPRLHERETELRREIYGQEYTDEHPTKCPDSLINGEAAEFKTSSKNNMSKRVKQASEQANTVVLKLTEPMSSTYIKRFIRGQWELADRENVKKIIILNNGKKTTFHRPIKKAKAKK